MAQSKLTAITPTRRRPRKVITHRGRMATPNRIVREFIDDRGVQCTEIALHGDLTFLIESRDYPKIAAIHWVANNTASGYYVRASCRNLYAHRVIMGEPPRGQCVDHINSNPLDCRRSNLRVTDYSHNLQRKRVKVGRSGFRGVYASGKTGWSTKIEASGRVVYLGRFKTALAAARAYDAAAREFFGEYAAVNFPEEVVA